MTDFYDLASWGWDAHFAAALTQLARSELPLPARVTSQDRDRWTVHTELGAGAMRIVSMAYAGLLPVTGDWVVVEPGPAPSDPFSLITVLPRRSAISRGTAGGETGEQVLAANVDVVWIVHGLDSALNARRIERYLAAAWESGASPEIVLTKADLATGLDDILAELDAIAIGVPVHVVSVEQSASIAELKSTLRQDGTYVLLGPSGVGKSTLLNLLADAALAATGEVRAYDQKGRHTTTRRELFQIAGGALLIDTPGLREFRIWSLDEGLAQTFPEIDELAASCHFRDCAHESEPGCAVLAAVAAGTLDPERLASYRKLKAEAAYIERKHDAEARAAAVAKHKTALKTLKYHPKYRRDS